MDGKLVSLAKKHFVGLSPAEERLCRDLENYGGADFSAESDRSLRSELVVWLTTSKDSVPHLERRRLFVLGAIIKGRLDWQGMDVEPKIVFYSSEIRNEIDIRGARFPAFCLKDTHTGPIVGDGARITDSLFIKNCSCGGGVRFPGTVIGSKCDLSGSLFKADDYALSLSEITIGNRTP